jgi:hypothetical protein
MLHLIDPEEDIRCFHSLMIEEDLVGAIRLVQKRGRIGTKRRELAEIHTAEIEARQALEAGSNRERDIGISD